ncbi:TonB-dependent receptor [Antarcticibacterium flavum]|uniref:TonB-dependent receptor n=1 Tax=Antarcticibacterium flavum TaxID=2058175 RepID=A0A5B7X583_9FLAO|nr:MULTISPECIES: TonB-dependent receptor [Antarcticibacterium]MCM4159708.1 TonB-dependent receptor [Antarcticibacterium sp. W02-3]QCY70644.1 TonB-dependent receptor [Antarcticibacterium flavum]
MQILSIKRSLFLFAFLSSGFLFAQDRPLGSETVIVVKPYTPSVNDAFKIRETLSASDSVRLEKKSLQYRIFSVPVASTFTPSKGQATKVERAQRVKLYNNYATLGFGTYSNILAEFYSNIEVNRSDNFGVFLTHNSSQGGIEGVRLDDKFYNTQLNLNYNSRNRNSSWNTEVGLQHQLFNWYGLPEGIQLSQEMINSIDPQQNYYSAFVGGELELYDSFFENATAGYRFFGDAYQSAEHHFKTDAVFELNIADELITTTFQGDFISGSFEEDPMFTGTGVNYSFLNVGLTPSLLILRDDLTLNLGVSLFYSLNAENSKNSIYLYPSVTASYRLGGDYFIPYAGVEGTLQQNSYYRLAQENPYVSPSLDIQPTDRPYDAYLGAKGKLSNSIGYNFRANYISEYNRPLYYKNSYAFSNGEDYSFGNSFGVFFTDLTTLSVYGEINVDVNRNFRLGLNAAYFDYSADNQTEAWNLPDFRANILADYQITDKWFAGANVFFVGERKDFTSSLSGENEVPRIVTLDSYIDLNANIGYRFNDQLSIFARGHNLLGDNYERWQDFPVQGIQVLAGATYKFDW